MCIYNIPITKFIISIPNTPFNNITTATIDITSDTVFPIIFINFKTTSIIKMPTNIVKISTLLPSFYMFKRPTVILSVSPHLIQLFTSSGSLNKSSSLNSTSSK